jgi:hypothetical protein
MDWRPLLRIDLSQLPDHERMLAQAVAGDCPHDF